MTKFQGSPGLTPFLWLDGQAEAAADFYISIFPNSRRVSEMRNSVEAPGMPVGQGAILLVTFELDGHAFMALNGGPGQAFTDAVSFVVHCDTQDEIDYYWSRLTADGGSGVACGWLKDKFGLRWQVVPRKIGELLQHPAAMQAMMGMVKLDMAALAQAGKT